MTCNADVVAVVVVYRPESIVQSNIEAAASQCARVVVVQNSPCDDLRKATNSSVIQFLDYRGNTGTAGGFNRGIIFALETGAERYVLLLDQDSRVSPAMVDQLAAAHGVRVAEGDRIGAVGATLRDMKVGISRTAQSEGASTGTMRPVESLASSGTLIARETLREVGMMDELLFIDAVDHEWCLRAHERGFGIYELTSAILYHNMGDRAVSWFGYARPLHDSPVRHYYIVRNSLLLMRRPYLTVSWRARELLLTIRRLVAYALLSKHRLQSSRYMWLAIRHGIAGRGGRLDQ